MTAYIWLKHIKVMLKLETIEELTNLLAIVEYDETAQTVFIEPNTKQWKD